jgi:hypothetical protein
MRPPVPQVKGPETERQAAMNDVTQQLAALQQMTTGELCERYRDLFGQPVRTRHKTHLVRKLAWRVQELAAGGLSERARRQAAQMRLSRCGSPTSTRARWPGG